MVETIPDLPVRTARTPTQIQFQLQSLSATCPVVIADGPGGIDDETATLLLVSDVVLLPVRGNIFDLRSTSKAVAKIAHANEMRAHDGRPPLITRVILNHLDRRLKRAKTIRHTVQKLGLPVANTVLRYADSFAEAPQQNTLVTRMQSPKARDAKLDLQHLFVELMTEVIPAPRQFGATAHE